MRLRNIPGSRETIAQSRYCIDEDSLPRHRGKWTEVFANDQPLCLEIGMGKGRFIHDMACAHPEQNFLGIEKYSSVLLRAVQKREELSAAGETLNNLFYIRMDAETITQVFAQDEVEVIYLNFSDPWPKDRHAHRRLPGPTYLNRYRQILAPDGRLEFKTDNDDLFAFALESARSCGWMVQSQTLDLHHDPVLNQGNILTEYEQRFSAKGNPIHKVVLTP